MKKTLSIIALILLALAAIVIAPIVDEYFRPYKKIVIGMK